MQTHSKNLIESVSCPFAVPMNQVEWEGAKVVSVDDRANTVIVETKEGTKFLVDIPNVLYDAIWKSGELNVIEQDVGFNDLT